MSFNCKILSFYRLVLETIKQVEKEINLTGKGGGGGKCHLLHIVNVCCYINRAITCMASHCVANMDCLSWATLLGGVNNCANTTPSNEKVYMPPVAPK